jgi:hypothetical protein
MDPEPDISDQPRDPTLSRWFAPVLEHGPAWCAPNLVTTMAFLRVDGIEVPLTVNEAEWDNSWICSPYTHYATYAREEIDRATGRLTSAAAGALLGGLGAWFRRSDLNRAVMVNNWLLSTNPWPRWKPRNLPGVLDALSNRWPDHAIVFRSLNEKESEPLLRALEAAGARIVPSRQVWWYEAGSEAVARSPEFRKDARLLRRGDLEMVPSEALGAHDFTALTALYEDLYLEKYSRHNPRFSAAWLQHLHREGLARFTALRNGSGHFVGVEACTELQGVLTSPVVGYDTSLPKALGLYRRLAVVPVLEARRRGIPLNLSAGVGRFKALRGGEPVMEYLAVHDRHLPASRRMPWSCIDWISSRILAPHVRRHGL